MAELLGVGEVILEQAHSPALAGGGDLVVAGAVRSVVERAVPDLERARRAGFAAADVAASPSRSATAVPDDAGQAIADCGDAAAFPASNGDRRSGGRRPVAAWTDAPADARMGDARRRRRAARDGSISSDAGRCAESRDVVGRMAVLQRPIAGRPLRFYLTSWSARRDASGKRPMAGVRLQLDRDGRDDELFGERRRSTSATLLARAPDLDDRRQPRAARRPALPDHAGAAQRAGAESAASALDGEIALDAAAGGRCRRPTIRGARGWVSGYIVPVLSGTMSRRAARRRRDVSRRRRRRLSRSQLGILGRRALAMGTGGGRRSLDRLRPRVSAGRRSPILADARLSRRPRTRGPDRVLDRRVDRRRRTRRDRATA